MSAFNSWNSASPIAGKMEVAAMVANSLAQLGKGKRANTAQAVTQAQASQMLNVSVDSIQRARIVEKNGMPSEN